MLVGMRCKYVGRSVVEPGVGWQVSAGFAGAMGTEVLAGATVAAGSTPTAVSDPTPGPGSLPQETAISVNPATASIMNRAIFPFLRRVRRYCLLSHQVTFIT